MTGWFNVDYFAHHVGPVWIGEVSFEGCAQHVTQPVLQLLSVIGLFKQHRALPPAQGVNTMGNRIKVITRMAHDYRGSEFFFMKLKSVFPGNS